jgi:hypothetical protein
VDAHKANRDCGRPAANDTFTLAIGARCALFEIRAARASVNFAAG